WRSPSISDPGVPGSASWTTALAAMSTLPDVTHPCTCSRGAPRRPSRAAD
ncbi:MAG: hypothetical protein AVDCRST_MAG66-2568, partial [uncultured Pseudonocardia sp.]